MRRKRKMYYVKTGMGACLRTGLDEDEVRYVEDKLIRKGLIDIGTKGRYLTFKGLLKIKEISK